MVSDTDGPVAAPVADMKAGFGLRCRLAITTAVEALEKEEGETE